MKNKYFIWLLRLVPAIILLQTLYFKFSAAPESVAIFTQLGAEPHGRILSGIAELIASGFLLSRLYWFGSILGGGVMAGAIVSHLFVLGISVADDGGLLFGLALLTFVCCLGLIFLEKEKLFVLYQKITKK